MQLFLTPLYKPRTDDEWAFQNYCRRVDALGLALFIAAYYYAGLALAPDVPDASAAQEPITGALNAVFAVHCLYAHMFVTPIGAKVQNAELWIVQTYLGRWVFLTRQVLCLQAVHCLASFFIPAVANALATILAGFGLFVTVQYFALIHWNPEFDTVCVFWAGRGVPYRELMAYVHLPAGIIAVIDVAVTKPRAAVLAATAPYTTIILLVAAFALYYICLVHGNHLATNEWPYPIMYPLGTDVKKWAVFSAVQVSTLVVFVTLACWVVWYAPEVV